ncbi:MAG: FAD-dependent oxidoreductase [Phycisphaerales bacterium]|nr:FAD-dependent oxidoreductase [Phycisphaerales bacterium]
MARSAIVVGGGLSGIAAAAALTDGGYRVSLIERREFLGGRATSFRERQTGQLLDNCQHVLLGCCTELLGLYRRLGVGDRIEFFDTIHFADERGRRGDLYACRLPSPFHLAPAMLGFGLLTMAQKGEIARGMAAMKVLGDEGREAVADWTFGEWLGERGQSAQTIERFWEVILVSALNARVDEIGANYGMQVFQEAFLGDRGGYRMALPRVPLAELYERAVAEEVLFNRRVTGLVVDRRGGRARVSGVELADGSRMEADEVVLATAPDSARRILGEEPMFEPIRGAIGRLRYAPIIGAHLFYDRQVMDVPHLALMGTTLQWLFRKDAAGMHIHGVISAAHDLAEVEVQALQERFEAEIETLLPRAAGAKVQRCVIVKEKRATYCPGPGIDRIRPDQRTGIEGLTLAGDYTRTGWPATMEGAVRGGNRAARVILESGSGAHRA